MAPTASVGHRRIVLLQARPVTTTIGPSLPGSLPQLPGDDAWPPADLPAQPFDLWTTYDVGERWPEPVTPFSWSTGYAMIQQNMDETMAGLKAPYTRQNPVGEACLWPRLSKRRCAYPRLQRRAGDADGHDCAEHDRCDPRHAAKQPLPVVKNAAPCRLLSSAALPNGKTTSSVLWPTSTRSMPP